MQERSNLLMLWLAYAATGRRATLEISGSAAERAWRRRSAELATDSGANPESRLSSQGSTNAIACDFTLALSEGNGSTLVIMTRSSIDTTSQLMLLSLTHRYAPAPTPGS